MGDVYRDPDVLVPKGQYSAVVVSRPGYAPITYQNACVKAQKGLWLIITYLPEYHVNEATVFINLGQVVAIELWPVDGQGAGLKPGQVAWMPFYAASSAP